MNIHHIVLVYHLRELGMNLLKISLMLLILSSIPPPIIRKIGIAILLIGAILKLAGDAFVDQQQQQ